MDKKDSVDEQPSLSELKFKQRLVYGGNLGLTFGQHTSINVSPKLGYRLNKRWIAGIGGTYSYLRIESRRGVYEDQIYGGEIFTNYRFYRNFIAVGKFELINVRTRPSHFQNFKRRWQPGSFIGIGYRQGVGGKVAFDIQLLYNFSYRSGISPYENPYLFNFNFFIF